MNVFYKNLYGFIAYDANVLEKWTHPFSVALHTQSNIMCMKHVQVFLYFVVCVNRIIENVHKTCTYRHVQDFVCACVTSLTTYVNTKVLAQIKLHVFNVHNHWLCIERHSTWTCFVDKNQKLHGIWSNIKYLWNYLSKSICTNILNKYLCKIGRYSLVKLFGQIISTYIQMWIFELQFFN